MAKKREREASKRLLYGTAEQRKTAKQYRRQIAQQIKVGSTSDKDPGILEKSDIPVPMAKDIDDLFLRFRSLSQYVSPGFWYLYGASGWSSSDFACVACSQGVQDIVIQRNGGGGNPPFWPFNAAMVALLLNSMSLIESALKDIRRGRKELAKLEKIRRQVSKLLEEADRFEERKG